MSEPVQAATLAALTMLSDLNTYMVPAFSLQADAFLRDFPDPVFLVEPFDEADPVSYGTADTGTGKAGKAQSVARIAKRKGANAFQAMVTLGRTLNNDVVITAPRVSKFHAYVTLDPEGRVELSDAGSTFGTTVQGQRLAPREEHRLLHSGDKVVLGGEVEMTYYTGPALYEFFRAQLGR